MASIEMVFTNKETKALIPFGMICMTRYGSVWNTMRRKRRWKEEFTESERERASRLFKQAYTWECTTGVPETVRMKPSTYNLWQKLAAFCCSL